MEFTRAFDNCWQAGKYLEDILYLPELVVGYIVEKVDASRILNSFEYRTPSFLINLASIDGKCQLTITSATAYGAQRLGQIAIEADYNRRVERSSRESP